MKIKGHIHFWVIYVLLESLIVYKMGSWNHKSLGHSILYHGSLLVPRLPITYVFIKKILPFILSHKQNVILKVILVVFYFAVSLLIYRVFLNKFSWPWIMDYLPQFNPFDVRLSSYSFLRVITPIGLLLGVLSIHKEYYLKLRNEELQKEQLRSELNFLKAQINPHFLFNSFNNLFALASVKSDKTAPTIAKLSSLFRYILKFTGLETVPIMEDILVMQNYIELEQLRYTDLDVTFNINISDPHAYISPLLMLPFIENTFKHGASDLIENGNISIDIIQRENTINMKCQNTIDPNEDIKDSQKGQGIKNVKRRLQLLFDDNFTLTQNRESNTYIVELSFPITYKKDKL